MHGAPHDRWPLLAIGSWLWDLEHSHLRVYVALTSLAAKTPTRVGGVDVPAGALVTSLERLADTCGVTKAVVRGALRALTGGPMRDGSDPAIALDTSPRGFTIITVHSTTLDTAPSTPPATSISSNAEDLGDRGHRPEHSSEHTQSHDKQHSKTAGSTASNTAGSTAPTSASTSSRIGLPVSSGAGEHSNQHEQPHGAPAGSQPGTPPALFSESGSGSDPGDSGRSTSTRTSVADPDPAPDRSEETRASRINDQMWKAADYLRSKILDANPEAVIGQRPWSVSKKTGLRLTWADEFRVMVERDKRRLTDAKVLMDWLFGGQTSEFKFVVQSPSALRAKWDRIVIRMKEEAAPRVAPPRASSVIPRKSEAL